MRKEPTDLITPEGGRWRVESILVLLFIEGNVSS